MAQSSSLFPNLTNPTINLTGRFGVLGEDVSATSDRNFDGDGNSIYLQNFQTFILGGDTVSIGSAAQGLMADFDWNSQSPIIRIGDIGNWGNNTVMTLTDATGILDISSLSNEINMAYSCRGQAGVDGSFQDSLGNTISVVGGIIVGITAP